MSNHFNVNQIINCLPHRYPFLLVDRVIDLVPNESITAIKNVTINEPFFQGHFPSQPVMPGVLQLEAMAQAAGFLAYQSISDMEGRLVYLMAMDKVKFRKMVLPGDQLRLEATILKRRRNAIRFDCKAMVDGQITTQAEILAAYGEEQ